MGLYAVATVYQFHFLSLGRDSYAFIVGPVAVLQLALFFALHSEPWDLVRVQVFTSAFLVLVSEAYERVLLRRSTEPV